MAEVQGFHTRTERRLPDALLSTRGADRQKLQNIKAIVHKELIQRVDLHLLTGAQESYGGHQQLLAAVHDLLSNQDMPLSVTERNVIAQEVLDELFGFGPLQPLFDDPSVSDVLVNTHRCVYVERYGLLQQTDVTFTDEQHLMQIIDKMVSGAGRRVDESSPMVDCRLPDGSRVNVILPPLAVDGPIVSIRRFGSSSMSGEDLIHSRMLTSPMLQLLAAAVKARLNIVVSGGTGAGKTTLLNVLSGFISDGERIVTIEDSAELQLKQAHTVRLETRPPNVEGKGAVRQRELVINALRMRPDRIILGEVRGEETLDMLQAMNTGHDGSITTVHSNTPRDAIARLETLAMMGDIRISEGAVRAQIASAVQLVVQVSRMPDGTRRVSHISEITGSSGDVVLMQDIFRFERTGLDGENRVKGKFMATGVMPKFATRLAEAGIPMPSGLGQHCLEV